MTIKTVGSFLQLTHDEADEGHLYWVDTTKICSVRVYHDGDTEIAIVGGDSYSTNIPVADVLDAIHSTRCFVK